MSAPLMDGGQLEGASLMSAESAGVPSEVHHSCCSFGEDHRAAYGNDGC